MVISSSTYKRKEFEEDASSTSAGLRAVVFSPRIPHDVHWGDCQSRLQDILQSCSSSSSLYAREDPFLEDVATIAAQAPLKSLHSHLSRNIEQAKQAQASILEEISQFTKQVHDESSLIASLEEQYQTLSQQSQDLQTQCDTLRAHIQEATRVTQSYQAQLDAAEQTVELARQERSLKVPRLQQQISLYATMTGIKWDYDHPSGVLAGEMKVPSENTIRRFRMDCEEHVSTTQKQQARFRIANQLWNMMEGGK